MKKQEKIQMLESIKRDLMYYDPGWSYICHTDTFREVLEHMDEMNKDTMCRRKKLLKSLRILDALALCKGVHAGAFLRYGEERVHESYGKSLATHDAANEHYRYWKVQLCDNAIELIRKHNNCSLNLTGSLTHKL